jgi:UV DNA damage endonuclease
VEDEQPEEGSPKRRRRRRKTPEEDRTYEIEPIAQLLPTSFKGRLGYACLNTILRVRDPPVFCSRTCRLATLKAYDEAVDDNGNLLNEPFVPDGINPHPHIRKIALQNATDLATLIRWNAENGIYFMRISSEMFPFASHPVHGYTLAFADEVLKEAGRVAREVGCRLTSHPGQFTQLGSPREKVVEAAAKDLECR